MKPKNIFTSMLLAVVLVVSGMAATVNLWAHESDKGMPAAEMAKMDHGQKVSAKNASWTTVKLRGEIIDLGCYVSHDGYGKKHKTCALECSKNGVPLALLENKTKKIYIIVATGHGENPYKEPVKFLADQVEVEGAVAVKGGTAVLMITSMEKVGT